MNKDSGSTINASEQEIEVLQSIYNKKDSVRQRDLAKIVGLSLGMTNSLLKRLVQKGLLQIRKINNRNIQYIVSPSGIDAISKKSYNFLKRTIRNIADYKETIQEFVYKLKELGYEEIVLVGMSDLDFIVEHCCGKADIRLKKDMSDFKGRVFYLYSEGYTPDQTNENQTGVGFLQKMLLL